MVRGAGAITPHLDGVPYFDKPPLLYWLMTGAFAWLGPTETAARLVSGLSAVAVAVLTALIGTRLAGARVGLMAGLMVAANLEMFVFGRMVKPDLLFLACILVLVIFLSLTKRDQIPAARLDPVSSPGR